MEHLADLAGVDLGRPKILGDTDVKVDRRTGADATARLIVETTSWAATRRLRDRDQLTVGDEAARGSLREFVVNALVAADA